MCMLIDGKTKKYQIYQKIALLFIFLHPLSIFQVLQPQAFGSEIFISVKIIDAFSLIICVS